MGKYLLEFLLSIILKVEFYLEVELLDHMVTLCLTLWGTATLLSPQELYHFIFLAAMHQGSNFSVSLPTLIIFLYVIVILLGVKWYLLVSIYISWITNDDVEHLLMCLSVICISFLEKCLLKTLPISESACLVFHCCCC